jgi:DNA gyrase subunit A
MEGDKILVLSSKGFGKISYAKDTDLANEDGTTRHYDGYRLTSRGAKGVISLKCTDKNGVLCAMRAVNGNEDLMVITNRGIVIRLPLEQVKISGRNTQGVKIIALEANQYVASLTIVPHIDEEAEAELEAKENAPEDEVNPALVAASEEPVKAKASDVVTPDDVDEDASSSDGVSDDNDKDI